MALIKGLKDLNKTIDRTNEGGSDVKWLKVLNGQSVKIRFLQELDPDSPNYNGKAGLGFIAVEHSNPKDFMKRALCTIEDQGVCFGCEQNKANPKTGWYAKKRLYINVLVDDGKEEPYVAIMSQGTGPKSATQEIVSYAVEVDSITNVTWKLKRTGEDKTTEYSIIPLPTAKTEPIDFSLYELFDLEKVAVRELSYPDQKAYFMGDEESAPESTDVEEDSSALGW
jgi:hypothetical protein